MHLCLIRVLIGIGLWIACNCSVSIAQDCPNCRIRGEQPIPPSVIEKVQESIQNGFQSYFKTGNAGPCLEDNVFDSLCGVPSAQERARLSEIIATIQDCPPLQEVLQDAFDRGAIRIVDMLPRWSCSNPGENPVTSAFASTHFSEKAILLERSNWEATPNRDAVRLLRHEGGHLLYPGRVYSNAFPGAEYSTEDMARLHGSCFKLTSKPSSAPQGYCASKTQIRQYREMKLKPLKP